MFVLKAFCEMEAGIPAGEMGLLFNGIPLLDNKEHFSFIVEFEPYLIYYFPVTFFLSFLLFFNIFFFLCPTIFINLSQTVAWKTSLFFILSVLTNMLNINIYINNKYKRDVTYLYLTREKRKIGNNCSKLVFLFLSKYWQIC